MQRVIAAFLAPFILTLFFIPFNIINRILVGGPFNFSFDVEGFLFVYIFALPAYLFIAIPVSLIIERINKGIRWLNYSLAGMMGGGILFLINTDISSQGIIYTLVTVLTYAVAGLSYYVSLALLENYDHKLQSKEE